MFAYQRNGSFLLVVLVLGRHFVPVDAGGSVGTVVLGNFTPLALRWLTSRTGRKPPSSPVFGDELLVM